MIIILYGVCLISLFNFLYFVFLLWKKLFNIFVCLFIVSFIFEVLYIIIMVKIVVIVNIEFFMFFIILIFVVSVVIVEVWEFGILFEVKNFVKLNLFVLINLKIIFVNCVKNYEIIVVISGLLCKIVFMFLVFYWL